MAFEKGDSVEIHSKVEGFEGSYFAATILMPLPEKKYLVQYKTLVTDDWKDMLQEVVDVREIRPTPPEVSSGFLVGDVVDVYDNEGWWIGKITGRSHSHYYVYFDYTDEEIGYRFSDVRVHLEWSKGRWLRQIAT